MAGMASWRIHVTWDGPDRFPTLIYNLRQSLITWRINTSLLLLLFIVLFTLTYLLTFLLFNYDTERIFQIDREQ